MKSNYFLSSIGRKQVVGLAGLLLCGFVLTHAAGNLLIFMGSQNYNQYSQGLLDIPGFFLVEIGLALIFLLHIVWAIVVTVQNKKANPKGYASSQKGLKTNTLLHKTLPIQGLVILFFLISHLWTLRFGAPSIVTYDGKPYRDMYGLLISYIKQPWIFSLYVVSIVILGAHLKHGLLSSLKTLGVYRPQLFLEPLAVLFSLTVSLGFLSEVIYLFIKG